MGVEKKFVEDGFTKALVNEFLTKELSRAGYGGMVMNRTPMGTQITVYAEKPGMVIGKGGKLIRRLTRDLDRKFRLDNPQVDVQDVGRSELNAQIVANRLANSLERGWYFRKAGQSMLRRVMDSGALGCEIILSGKVTGPRSRTEKFLAGYIKHAGKPSEEIVDHGYAVAVKKLGTIGCQVRIVPPGVKPPDKFNILAPPVEEEEDASVPVEDTKSEIDELIEASEEEPSSEAVPEEVPVVETEAVPEEVPAVETEAVPEEETVVEPEAVPEEETAVETETVPEPEPLAEETKERTGKNEERSDV